VLSYFFCSHKFHKIEYYVILEMLKKKFGPIFKELLKFYPKIFQYALKYMGLGSGIRKKPIPDPGSRGQKGTGSRIRIRNTAEVLASSLAYLFYRLFYSLLPYLLLSSRGFSFLGSLYLLPRGF
jgi:hypothetical protein